MLLGSALQMTAYGRHLGFLFVWLVLRLQASTFNNLLTSGLQSLWMMHHLLGNVHLPNPATMLKVR